jgi:aspartate/methionine/tyrosine aminotransferase
VGYLVGPPDLIAGVRTKATNTYISPNMVAQSIVAEFCRSGALDRSIQTVKVALRERRDATCQSLERDLPDARFVSPEGGYFLWVTLPEGADVEVLQLPLATNARAKMSDLRDGFVKLFTRRSTGVVVGGVVVAPGASELILPIALAVTKGLTADDLAHTFAIYPSLSGSITEAGRRLMGIDDAP